MTREEAIEILKELWRYGKTAKYNDTQIRKALDMAIEALKQIRAIEGIIDVSNLTIQEDVLKYKMIVDVVKGDW